jgi:methionine synthase II (cobalamin-independent)
MELTPVVEGFMNAASPGVIALFQPNRHYPDHESYLETLANAMQAEYEAITEAGLILQFDSPNLGLGSSGAQMEAGVARNPAITYKLNLKVSFDLL